VYLQAKRDGAAAKRFFKRLLRKCRGEPRKIVTDKLRSYLVAHREVITEAIHVTDRYENNRAEQSQSLPRFMGTKTPGCESEVCGGSSRLIRLSAS
jgi:putative transposase